MLRYHRGSKRRKQLPLQGGRGWGAERGLGLWKLRLRKWNSDLWGGGAAWLALVPLSGGAVQLLLQMLETLQSEFSCCYGKDLPLLEWRSVAGKIFMGTGSKLEGAIYFFTSSPIPAAYPLASSLQSLIEKSWQSRNAVCRAPAQHCKEYRKMGWG